MVQSSIIVCFALKEEAAPFREMAAVELYRIWKERLEEIK
jgi:hypothetical protein